MVTTDRYLLLPELLKNIMKKQAFQAKPEPDSYTRFLNLRPFAPPRKQSAFLKISEGCSNKCRFCSIPLIRGPLISRPVNEIIEEARILTTSGILELNLIGQDITAYGQDQPNLPNLASLIRLLLKKTQARWIRLNYCHPRNMTEEIIELIAGEERICPYLDLPLQHINQQILKAMARGYSSKKVIKLLENLFQKIPKLQIVSSFIVGFPGETDEHFQQLLEFIRQGWFRYINVFPFSRETGTKAELYPNNNSSRKIKERKKILVEAQRQVFIQQAEKWKNMPIPLIMEGSNRNFRFKGSHPFMGRSLWDAPEDARVFLRTKSGNTPQGIIKARIEGRDGYDLLAVS
jgi:ribosomal protein S12 methylthiotransferase